MSEDKDDVSKEISDNNSSESEDYMSIISISEETNKSETSGLESSSWHHYENIRFAILNIFINSLLHITLVINVSKLLTSK